MASSPPSSPAGRPQRPLSALLQARRSSSRISVSSKQGGGSRASDEEGKTSVKVAIRIRPPLNPSDPGFDLIPQRFQRPIAHVTSPTGLAVDSPQGRKLFVFDRVFGEDVQQEGIWEYLGESVNAFVQGYNVSVLAYGQSGSGKSYTMGTSGPLEQADPKMMGVIPRAAAALFYQLGGVQLENRNSLSALRTPKRFSLASVATNSSMTKAAKDRDWIMKATYVEIYNEQLRDLLLPESIPPHERSAVIIREDTKGRILLTGLHQVNINSIDDLLGALNSGSSIRQTDATAINAKSSRSHAVFSLTLTQRKNKSTSSPDKRLSVPVEAMNGSENWVTIESKLHFKSPLTIVMQNTGAQGERAKEGISINAGLASLGKVISQLSSRQSGSHISYRDSRLTRLLQDSLGGNALTYMVACVNPAEFHLSETLNTVQYAQRARAIQSKPQIQQIADDSDKQAVIDRLRAEIAFLREQIRNTERSDRRNNAPQERAERQNEREHDLQNQLLDLQESYSALGQRHAKLISDMAKAQNVETLRNQNNRDTIADSAFERLKRSNSFAEAVEQVILEYEKTIQSLETSLANTRSSLSTTESSLLEKETKCAYSETLTHQLQARIQKMIDRESSTESYLHELETKLDGHTSGEEKNATIIVELRKEIARVRENEASCEDYISTLEERLAEADQDAELMQREIDRLEHVVERQRSLGKLDSLLYELDHAQKNMKKSDAEKPSVNGHPVAALKIAHKDQLSDLTPAEMNGGQYFDAIEEIGENPPSKNLAPEALQTGRETIRQEPAEPITPEANEDADGMEYPAQSPAQSRFVAEKLDTVTQELLDLRSEHENTVNQFELLSAKYEEALRTLSQLQDAVDEARHPMNREVFATPASTRPSSFLGDVRVIEGQGGTRLPSSRSLSSELFSVGQSPNTTEPSDVENTIKGTGPTNDPDSPPKEELLQQEVKQLKRLQSEKEGRLSILVEEYEKLQEQHQGVLDEVEELKTEVSKAKMSNTTNLPASLIRRKSSQGIMMVDRAHRSFASLRNIATENFEDKPDIMQNFELHLNTAMHELYARSERVQELEADITTVKKEMETKMAIISGLTRERSSLKNSSPMDISVVSTMRDQLLQSENQIRVLQETQSVREQTLLAEIGELKASLDSLRAPRSGSGSVEGLATGEATGESLREKKVVELPEELGHQESRHQSTVESIQASDSKLNGMTKETGAFVSQAESVKALEVDKQPEQGHIKWQQELETERAAHLEVVKSLQSKIEEYTESLTSYMSRVAELEHAQASARRELEESSLARDAQEAELDSHRELVTQLEKQVYQHQSAIHAQEEGLKSLQELHASRLEELEEAVEADVERHLAEQASGNEEMIHSLQAELTEAKDEMGRLLQSLATLLNEEMTVDKVQTQVEVLVQQKADSDSRYATIKAERDRLSAEHANLRATISELTTINEESVKEIQRLNEQYQKSSRIVEDLEEQLTANFDQHQAANNRLSLLATERNHQLEEVVASKNQAVSELEAVRAELARLEAKLYPPQVNGGGLDDPRPRSNSITTNVRKSSIVSLPSPPPAIPLPPLPSNAQGLPPSLNTKHSGLMSGVAMTRAATSPHPARDYNALIEDLEARIRVIENSLVAEKQLNYALEEALADLEIQGKKATEDLEVWKKKAWAHEDEIEVLKNNQKNSRYSLQAVEEERTARMQAEAARAHLEERMNALNKKKKKSSLNCF
ncbi:MAG: hypothetical protein M1816_002821 [Peltula sp. TS41687]|nr:MAG: hypothetical protein M1816_002821 [Peltula sp. TS41687]